jgi:hypothetical protein
MSAQVRDSNRLGIGTPKIVHQSWIWDRFMKEPSLGNAFVSIVHVRPPGAAASTILGRALT